MKLLMVNIEFILVLNMGVGDANRLAEYIVANANSAVDIDQLC